MNPELRRNLWLELSPRRMLLMALILGLVFFAAAVAGGNDFAPAAVAEVAFYFLVVIWGARNAGLSVVGEIRDRTWDSQKLSALTPAQMFWGKLFGSTAYNWFGGLIALAVILVYDLGRIGVIGTLIDFVYFIALGLIAQAVSMLVSLVAVRRRQTHSRFEVFLYQLAGVVAAIAVYYVWRAADPAGSLIARGAAVDTITWWGMALDARSFLLVSLAVFTGWTLLACYRQMRLELMVRNGPLVWIGFLIFIGLYVAGFNAWLSANPAEQYWDVVARRLLLVATVFGSLTYLMVLLEQKDRVLYRWMGGQLARARIDRVFWNFQSWMMSYFAAFVVVAALVGWLHLHAANPLPSQALLVAALGFLTRDCAIFVLFQALAGRRRADFAALAVLVALYGLLPAIIGGMGVHAVGALFYPLTTDPVWLSPALAWGEAAVAVILALGSLALSEKPAPTRRVMA